MSVAVILRITATIRPLASCRWRQEAGEKLSEPDRNENRKSGHVENLNRHAAAMSVALSPNLPLWKSSAKPDKSGDLLAADLGEFRQQSQQMYRRA